MPYNELQKAHVSNWTENSQIERVPHYELIPIESSWFHLQMRNIQIPPN
jgi:hypothetical protein